MVHRIPSRQSSESSHTGFEARVDVEGWAVFDIETGRRVRLPGDPLRRMQQADADDLVDLLNTLQRQGVWQIDRYL
jgi:hypothetical protein